MFMLAMFSDFVQKIRDTYHPGTFCHKVCLQLLGPYLDDIPLEHLFRTCPEHTIETPCLSAVNPAVKCVGNWPTNFVEKHLRNR